MQLTVKDLIEMPELKIRLLSGERGINKKIVWAHTSELENPSEWVQPNSLIMTTGLGIPKTAAKQKDYIQRIIDADLAGLLISDKMNAPKDLTPLIEVANQHNFPISFIDYNVPFIEIARLVMEANKDKRDVINNHLVKLLYEHTHTLMKEPNIKALLMRINSLLNMPAYLVNTINPEEALFDFAPLPEALLSQLIDVDLNSQEIRKIYQKSSSTLHVVPLKARGFALLISDKNISQELLQNLGVLFSFYIESRKENSYERMILSGEFLDDILNERISDAYIEKKLTNYQLVLEDSCVIIAKQIHEINYQKIFFKFAIHGLFLFKKEKAILITARHNIDKLATIFQALGISDEIKKIHRIHDAFREATLAYKNCSAQFPMQNYSNQNYSQYTLPKSLEEAERIFELNLGKLYTQDQNKKTRYIHTLRTFLINDRSWEKTAKILHIHKQTLVYRIQKIQEMTGRQTNSTADIVELWIALKAGEILGLVDE